MSATVLVNKRIPTAVVSREAAAALVDAALVGARKRGFEAAVHKAQAAGPSGAAASETSTGPSNEHAADAEFEDISMGAGR